MRATRRNRPVSVAACLVGVSAVLTLAACSSRSVPAPSGPAPTSAAESASGPSGVYLAIVGSAADPNALEDRRAALVGSLDDARAIHVILEQGACYPGIPARYGDRYILAVWDDGAAPVQADLATAGERAEWSGRATVTCLD